VRHALNGGIDVDLSIYAKNLESQVIGGLVARFDPLRGKNQNLLVLTNDGEERGRGFDLRVEGRLGAALLGWIGYAFQHATTERSVALGVEGGIPTLNGRPHSFAGSVALEVPADWKAGSVGGAILRNVGVYTTFRGASGTPYTSCSPNTLSDQSVLSPDLCSVIISTALNDSRLPTLKQLDLRLVKRFGPGGRFAGFLDARNLFNFKNVFAVFAATGEPINPTEVDINWSADSADLSNEAQANGRYAGDGTIDLGQALPDPGLACGTWTDQAGDPSAPSCIYLIRAEERFGDGDHLFDLTEQRRASEALYRAVRGPQEITGPPRRIRLGLELGL